MTRRSWLALLALALMAPAALASAPRGASPTLPLDVREPALAPLEPAPATLVLEQALVGEEHPGFPLGLESLDAPRQRLAPLEGAQLLDEDLAAQLARTGDAEEPRYPETRIGGLRLFGQDLVVVSTPVSVDVRWGCADFGCGIAEGIGSWLSEDPAGTVDSPSLYAFVGNRPNLATDPTGRITAVDPTIGRHDLFGQVNLETGNAAVDFWLLSPINNALNVVGGIGNSATNILGLGDDAMVAGLRAAGANDTDIEFLRIYMVTNPGQVTAALRALRLGMTQGRVALGRLLERLREAQNEQRALGMSHPERGAWVPGGAKVRKGHYTDRRPNTRKVTPRQAWDKAQPGTDPSARACPTCGRDVFGNPNTGELRNTPEGWDLEHVQKWEKIRRQLADRDATPQEYRDAYNDLNNTILRCRACNRSDNRLEP